MQIRMKNKSKKNVHYNGMKNKIATDKLSMQPTNERQHMTRYWPNSLSPQWSRQAVITVSRHDLEDHENMESPPIFSVRV